MTTTNGNHNAKSEEVKAAFGRVARALEDLPKEDQWRVLRSVAILLDVDLAGGPPLPAAAVAVPKSPPQPETA